jgi:hypothetical protein
MIRIAIAELSKFPKDVWDYTDEENPIKTYEAPYRYSIVAQKDDEVLAVVEGDISAFEASGIVYQQYNNDTGFKDINRGIVRDNRWFRQYEVDNLTVSHGGHEWDANEQSQERLMRAKAMLEETGLPSIQWKCKANHFEPLTLADVKTILLAAGAGQQAIWEKYG